MFNKCVNGIITINRGDTINDYYRINLGDAIVPDYKILQGEDKLYVALMEPNQPFEHARIRQVYTSENMDGEFVKIYLASEMTQNLLPGTYYYTIKLVEKENDVEIVTTIVPNTKFVIFD